MTDDQTTNQHFRRLLEGASREAAARFGEAFLELHAQRSGKADADACSKLRSAWLELARNLLRERADALNPQQQLFIYSGAVADSVTLRDAQGEKLSLELLPTALYEALLSEFSDPAASPVGLHILHPAHRLHILASGQLKPFDANRSGRWSEEQLSGPAGKGAAAAQRKVDPAELEKAYERCQQLQQQVGQRTRALVEVLASENLGPVMQGLMHPGNELRRISQDGKALASLSGLVLGSDPRRHESVTRLRRLSEQFSRASADVERGQLELLDGIASAVQLASRLNHGADAADAPQAMQAVELDERGRKLVESDYSAMAGFVNQTLINDARRSSWSSSRVLLAEQFDKAGDPLNECLLSPAMLQQSLQAMQRLHINCFPEDSAGNPIIPAICVEPGVGIVKWMDDRFIASFVQIEQPRQGSELSLSSTDIAALRIMGLFLARGDIFNYRGERISDSFMAEYAGHIEQKATVKFTGASKKLSYGTSTEEKDGASRDDAVSDYIDFIFAINNNLPIPKKISPRKIGILLKYCVFRDVWHSACLVMRLVAPSDHVLARDILLAHAQHYGLHCVELIRHSLEADQQVAARYRNDSELAIKEILGKLAAEYTRQADSGLKPGETPSGDAAAETVHDYFDV